MPQPRIGRKCSYIGNQHQNDVSHTEDHAKTLDQHVIAGLDTLHDQRRQTAIAKLNFNNDHPCHLIGKVQRHNIDNRADGVEQRMTENDPPPRHAFENGHLDIG